MGWKETQARRKATSLTAPRDEDLVGRRVLNGLNLVERQLLPVCRNIFGRDIKHDEGTWPLTLKLLHHAWRRLSDSDIGRLNLRIEVYAVGSSSGEDVIDRFDMWNPATGETPVFMVRLKGTKQSLTYSIWSKGDIGLRLKPPYKVITELNGYHIAVQDTKHFVEQFGPYDWTKVLQDD